MTVKEGDYELVKFIFGNCCDTTPEGIDTSSETVGNAKQIIKYLLEHDVSVKSFRLTKKSPK